MRRLNQIICITLFSLLFLCTGCITDRTALQQTRQVNTPTQKHLENGENYKEKINDSHCHLVNFIQDSEGILDLLEQMDNANVENIVLFGLPVVKKWDFIDHKKPIYYNDNDSEAYYYSLTDIVVARAVTQLDAEHRRRVYPLICGFNPTDKNAIDHIEKMVEWYPDLWQGIGEILTRHDDLTRMTQGEIARADHPALDPVYNFAAAHDMPVLIHSNIGTAGVKDPLYLNEIRNAVKKHPDTRIVWCHAGHSIQLKIPAMTDIVDKMLNNNKNLWIDLSWVVYEDVIAPDGVLDPRWISLIEKYPDRFLIGSDKIGAFGTYRAEIRKYEPLLKALIPPVASKIAYENLREVLPSRK